MEEEPQEVELHSMDIPHVAAVELPLLVKNEDKAIKALGGKQKISDSIKDSSIPLELRLRNDPFQHPIQAAYSTNERIVLKIQIKKDIVKNNPNKSIQELIKLSETKPKVKPIAIIDKTYRFRGMSDFQVITKRNKMIQQFKSGVLEAKNYDTVKNYVLNHENFYNLSDMNNEYFENKDHQLPPPPIFSHINYPYTFKYQKNPFTSIVKDEQSGDLKLISRKVLEKLHTVIIPYEKEIPKEPPQILTKKYEELIKSRPSFGSPDDMLVKCIEWVKHIFDIKPFWLRRQLVDIIPKDYLKHLKNALPFVTYVYKSGPWRFCNIKIGIDPKSDPKYWIYQTEYFRVLGRSEIENDTSDDNKKKIIPKTLEDSKTKIEISQDLIFDGINLPTAITFQIGDITDMDITSIITIHKQNKGSDFLKNESDFQNGWINNQTIELIRKIMRYKLNCMVKEESIDQNKIYKFTTLNFNKEDSHEKEIEDGQHDEDQIIDDTLMNDEEVGDEAVGEDEEEVEDGELHHEIDEDDLMSKLQNLISENKELQHLVGFVKQ
ncbi:TFC1 [Candida pseudojiufengensis]|uniref:TFC1 n=1 Tax=Candida pseudojiufengensis TaxID=497109 RepID=UPI002223FAC1|nr:TFC1 [Candida pseudojiufengensis]KAI5965727.1 TFC1 [Candida pseudojiufengensis]